MLISRGDHRETWAGAVRTPVCRRERFHNSRWGDSSRNAHRTVLVPQLGQAQPRYGCQLRPAMIPHDKQDQRQRPQQQPQIEHLHQRRAQPARRLVDVVGCTRIVCRDEAIFSHLLV
eukprot:5605610-Prymnesium_polylepis.1